MKNFVAYYRVSTAKQGQSGLGLEAQEEAVERLIAFRNGTISKAYREVESGANNARPLLAEALATARAENATLVVAKLDRLARDARFLLTLADSGVPILFGDFPDLDATTPVGRMVLTQMAAVAEFERRRISERVSAALQAAKARGTKLGGFRGGHFPEAVHEAGRARKVEMADENALKLFETIRALDPENVMNRAQLARLLNEKQIKTPRGADWQVTTLTRLFKRVEAIHERNRAAAAKSIRSVSHRLQKQSRSVCERGVGGRA